VRRFLKILTVTLILSALVPLPATNGMTDEEKKQAFLKAREEMQTVEEPTPAESTPTPKPKPAGHHKPSPSSSPGQAKHKITEETTPTPAHKATQEPETTPEHKPAPPHEEQPAREGHKTSTPVPTPAPVPKAVPMPTPAPVHPQGTPVPEESRAPVVIQKENIHNEPQPPPPQEAHGWWPWSRPANYHYLTRSVIDAIRKAPVSKGRWRYIVVHNSGTRQGNAKVFDYYHRHTRHMPNGLAYHFVIGNGTSSGDGQIEIGDRWRRQLDGGHVHSDFLNSIALGICLVGDFNRDLPTKAQLESLDELIRYLRERVGRYEGHVAVVKAHKEINPVPTDCPGNRFPYHWLHQRFDL
jgi:hypothetical protein